MPSPVEIPAPGELPGRRPRVLAVVTFFPWPQNHGDALRRLMFLEALAATSDLTAVCIERPETTPEDVAELRNRLQGAEVVVMRPWQRKLTTRRSQVMRVVRGLATGTPPWIYRQWSPDVAPMLETVTGDRSFDLAVLIGEPAGIYVGHTHATRVVWDKSNVLTASDLDALKTVSSAVGKARALVGLPFSFAFERRVLRRVEGVVVTSEEEEQRLHRRFGPVPAVIIPSAMGPQARGRGIDHESRTLLWLSTLSYTPNWDGLLRFLEATDDTFRRKGLTLRVVGAGATPRQIETLSRFRYVDYRGFVDDLTDACDGVAAGVVPVWAGAGVKLKTLTLMGLGVPVVATPVALEGVPHEAAARVARTPADFAAALEDLDPRLLTQAATRARTVLHERFSREIFFRSVADEVARSAD